MRDAYAPLHAPHQWLLKKKADNHAHMVALYTVWYNFVRQYKTLRMSPAMAAGVTDRLWEIGDIVDVLEAWEQSFTHVAKKII